MARSLRDGCGPAGTARCSSQLALFIKGVGLGSAAQKEPGSSGSEGSRLEGFQRAACRPPLALGSAQIHNSCTVPLPWGLSQAEAAAERERLQEQQRQLAAQLAQQAQRQEALSKRFEALAAEVAGLREQQRADTTQLQAQQRALKAGPKVRSARVHAAAMCWGCAVVNVLMLIVAEAAWQGWHARTMAFNKPGQPKN